MSDFVYLDNAATTFPKPPEVIRFMCDFYATRGLGRDEARIAYVLNRNHLARAVAVLKAGLAAYPHAPVAAS